MNNTIIKGALDCFIIPNGAIDLSKSTMYNKDEKIANMKKVCELNGVEFDPEKDRIVELWYCGNDFKTTNLCDHGGHVTVGKEDCGMGFDTKSYLPSKLLRGHREGDVINVKIPGWIRKNQKLKILYKTTECEDATFDIYLKLNQRDYRYGWHGDFEDVLDSIGG